MILFSTKTGRKEKQNKGKHQYIVCFVFLTEMFPFISQGKTVVLELNDSHYFNPKREKPMALLLLHITGIAL